MHTFGIQTLAIDARNGGAESGEGGAAGAFVKRVREYGHGAGLQRKCQTRRERLWITERAIRWLERAVCNLGGAVHVRKKTARSGTDEWELGAGSGSLLCS
eukprot:TRINITY_DN63811_c0_g1_i1.p1 TRINITY_DN63811_c0_g1~~TRINITY_DN63811_c0_g1_i1.p1  ORF type:complete len:101 (+),score=10.59 TRINITY_DN63811_c0_g1_i1:193-495(+)